MTTFSGLGMHLGVLARLSHASSRSISPENPTGAKGRGGMAKDGPAANGVAKAAFAEFLAWRLGRTYAMDGRRIWPLSV